MGRVTGFPVNPAPDTISRDTGMTVRPSGWSTRVEAAEAHLRELGSGPATLDGASGFSKIKGLKDSVYAVYSSAECQRFDHWLVRLESLPADSGVTSVEEGWRTALANMLQSSLQPDHSRKMSDP